MTKFKRQWFIGFTDEGALYRPVIGYDSDKTEALSYHPKKNAFWKNCIPQIACSLPSGKYKIQYQWKQSRGKSKEWKWMKVGIKTSSAKAKGRELQQWFGKRIARLTGFEFGKDCPIESRGMGQSGVDLRLEPCVLEKFPFSVECKSGKSISLQSTVKQAIVNQIDGTDWLVCLKYDNDTPLVVMDANVFFRLIRKRTHA